MSSNLCSLIQLEVGTNLCSKLEYWSKAQNSKRTRLTRTNAVFELYGTYLLYGGVPPLLWFSSLACVNLSSVSFLTPVLLTCTILTY